MSRRRIIAESSQVFGDLRTSRRRSEVMRPSGRVRFMGGLGRRGPRTGTTPTGRVRSSPRWSPAAAASAYRAIRATAAGQGQQWTIFLAAAFVHEESWARLMRAIASSAVPAMQRECVNAVLAHHKEKALAMAAADRKAAAESLARAMRRRAAECPALRTIGVPSVRALTVSGCVHRVGRRRDRRRDGGAQDSFQVLWDRTFWLLGQVANGSSRPNRCGMLRSGGVPRERVAHSIRS